MAQPSVSSYFNTRKRGIEDEIISNKKKVICLDRVSNPSEALELHSDSKELANAIVYPKAPNHSSSDEESKKTAKSSAVRQGITPARRTRSRKVHMQEVDGIEVPKIINFWKGGNLSPQKKPKSIVEAKASPAVVAQDDSSKVAQSLTPHTKSTEQATSSAAGTVEKTSLLSTNGMQLDEIKKKLKGSSRLADLKTSINKLQNGFDKLEQMESKRLANPMRPKAAEPSSALKPFKSIELEIMR
jgi:chromatin licensing and DNA replication factor 1